VTSPWLQVTLIVEEVSGHTSRPMKHVFAYANFIPKCQSILRGAIVLGHKDLQTHLHLLSCMLSIHLVHLLEITFLRAECYNAEPDLALGIPILPPSSISLSDCPCAPHGSTVLRCTSFLRRGHYITRYVDLRVSAIGLNTAAPAAILPTGCLYCRCTEKGGHCGPRQAITSAFSHEMCGFRHLLAFKRVYIRSSLLLRPCDHNEGRARLTSLQHP